MRGAGNVYSLHLRAYGGFIHGFQFLAWHGEGAGLLPLYGVDCFPLLDRNFITLCVLQKSRAFCYRTVFFLCLFLSLIIV
jgi:hypothetical protein